MSFPMFESAIPSRTGTHAGAGAPRGRAAPPGRGRPGAGGPRTRMRKDGDGGRSSTGTRDSSRGHRESRPRAAHGRAGPRRSDAWREPRRRARKAPARIRRPGRALRAPPVTGTASPPAAANKTTAVPRYDRGPRGSRNGLQRMFARDVGARRRPDRCSNATQTLFSRRLHGSRGGMLESRALRAFAGLASVAVFLLAPFVLLPAESAGLPPWTGIRIEGDAGFTQENGVTAGSGTAGDPYVIEGWRICNFLLENPGCMAFQETAITVRNTSAHLDPQ